MRWENLTVNQFAQAVEDTGGFCVVPIGCLEKHGGHLPLGTDIFIIRTLALAAAEREPAVVFPFYPFGQISEVRHMQGSIALEATLQLQLMQAMCDEIARNGFTKILLANGHGGNGSMLPYFCQSQLDKRRGYQVYYHNIFNPTPEQWAILDAKYGHPAEGGHADFYETSSIMDIEPSLVHMEAVVPEETRSKGRAAPLNEHNIYTGLNWYMDYPNQVAGDPTGASPELGRDLNAMLCDNMVAVYKAIKNQTLVAELHEEFFSRAENPGV